MQMVYNLHTCIGITLHVGALGAVQWLGSRVFPLQCDLAEFQWDSLGSTLLRGGRLLLSLDR